MSNTTNDGGPAFPVTYEHEDATAEFHGMTLRDWFAGQAMQAILTAGLSHDKGAVLQCDPAAEAAYRCADSMLKARG